MCECIHKVLLLCMEFTKIENVQLCDLIGCVSVHSSECIKWKSTSTAMSTHYCHLNKASLYFTAIAEHKLLLLVYI